MNFTMLNKNENYYLRVIKSLSEMDCLRSFWEAEQFYPSADFEFFKLILETRPNILFPCIITLFRGDNPVALLSGRIENTKLPIRVGYATILSIPVRQLVFVPGGFMGERTGNNLGRLLVPISHVMSSLRLDCTVFERIRIGQIEHDLITRAFKSNQLGFSSNIIKHWILHLPKTWEDFLKSRKAKHRYWLRRLPRVLNRDFGGEWEIKRYSTLETVEKFAEAAESVASNTYQRAIGAGFRLNEEYLHRLKLEARRGQLRGYILFIKNKPQAFWYCFTYNHVLYLAATGYNPDYRKYELGTVLLMKVFQDHCGSKITTVDFGEGDSDYKRRYASEFFEEESIIVFPRSMRGLFLRTIHNSVVYGTMLAKKFIDRLGLLQKLKTYWRRRLLINL